MLRVATTVIVAALMAASLASAGLANHPGHGGGGGQTTLSDLGCGPNKIARVNAADEWECNADLTANEAAAIAAQAAADAAQGTADGAATAAAAAQADAATAQATLQNLLTTLSNLENRIFILEGGGAGGKRVFVTSQAVPLGFGGFNSVATADTICRTAAVNGGLISGDPEVDPVFFAWLSAAVTAGSSVATSPSERFNKSASSYVDVLGNVIANDWNDLTDDTLITAILLDEFGVEREDIGVWTGTSPNGTPSGCDCGSWQVTAVGNCDSNIPPFSAVAATIGDSTASNVTWTDLAIPPGGLFGPEQSACNTLHALYCFEQ